MRTFIAKHLICRTLSGNKKLQFAHRNVVLEVGKAATGLISQMDRRRPSSSRKLSDRPFLVVRALEGAITFGLVTIPGTAVPRDEPQDAEISPLRESDHSPVKYRRVAEVDGIKPVRQDRQRRITCLQSNRNLQSTLAAWRRTPGAKFADGVGARAGSTKGLCPNQGGSGRRRRLASV
jgi:hypothetical protein